MSSAAVLLSLITTLLPTKSRYAFITIKIERQHIPHLLHSVQLSALNVPPGG